MIFLVVAAEAVSDLFNMEWLSLRASYSSEVKFTIAMGGVLTSLLMSTWLSPLKNREGDDWMTNLIIFLASIWVVIFSIIGVQALWWVYAQGSLPEINWLTMIGYGLGVAISVILGIALMSKLFSHEKEDKGLDWMGILIISVGSAWAVLFFVIGGMLALKQELSISEISWPVLLAYGIGGVIAVGLGIALVSTLFSPDKLMIQASAQYDLMTNLIVFLAFLWTMIFLLIGVETAAKTWDWEVSLVEVSYTTEVKFAGALGIGLAGVLIHLFSPAKSYQNALGFLAFAVGGGLSSCLLNTSLISASAGSILLSIVLKAATYFGYVSAASLAVGLVIFVLLFIQSSVQNFLSRPKCVSSQKKTPQVCTVPKYYGGAIVLAIFFIGGGFTLVARYFLVSSESTAEYELVRKIITYSLYGGAAAWILGAAIFFIGVILSLASSKSVYSYCFFWLLCIALIGAAALLFLWPVEVIPRTSIQTLLPGDSMNITQYLAPNCTQSAVGCNPHIVFLTERCNLVLAEGNSFTGENTVNWQSNTQANCEGGRCEDCSVSLDSTTGSLSVQNGAKKLWSSRAPKKTTSVNGTYAASITSAGVFTITKGNQSVVTVAHAPATGVYST